MKLTVNQWRDAWHEKNTGLSFEQRQAIPDVEQLIRGYPVKMMISSVFDIPFPRLVIWGLNGDPSLEPPIYLDKDGILQFVNEPPNLGK